MYNYNQSIRSIVKCDKKTDTVRSCSILMLDSIFKLDSLTLNFIYLFRRCIQEVREWLRENFLLLNENKLKLLFLGRTPLRSNCKLANRLLAAYLLLQV